MSGVTMNACIFAGPTLPLRDEARSFSAIWLPPAKHGDVYRVVSLLRPRAIGIVDGYFQWVPSVWHKEILWAIHQGVHVFGSASMGALRAAELAPFGMQGVGRIFDAYRNGVFGRGSDGAFEDDDEVAVVHGPPESGYIAASESMVNIRCTLDAAASAGVIAAPTRVRLSEIAKAVFFTDRSYELVFAHARTEGLPASELDALEAWLPSGRVDQKRIDALAMIEAMQALLARDLAPATPNFRFQHTSFWELAFAAPRETAIHDTEDAAVLNELRIAGERWDALKADALASLLSAGTAETATPEALAKRLAERSGEPLEAERLLEEAARTQAVRSLRDGIPPAIVECRMLDRMRGTDEHARLRARAEDKHARIAMAADLPHVEEFSPLQLLQLRDWYFSQVLGWDMPDDLEQRARAWGYCGLPDFHRAIFAEYVYRQMTDAADMARRAATGEAQPDAT